MATQPRRVSFSVAGRTIERDTRHSPLQDRLLDAFGSSPPPGSGFRRLNHEPAKIGAM